MKAILDSGKALISGLAGIVLAGTSIHEWLYHEHHKYASGPSVVIAVGCAAAAVVAFVVMFMATEIAEREEEIDQLINQLGRYVDDRFEELDRSD